MKRLTLVGVVVGLLIVTNVAAGKVWYVHPDSGIKKIQAGLDSCGNNDIVLVGRGTYIENIVWPNRQGIHLISEWGPQYTIIDGDSAATVIAVGVAVDTTTVIRGFKIQHGRG